MTRAGRSHAGWSMAVAAPVDAGRRRRTPAIAATTNTAGAGNGTSRKGWTAIATPRKPADAVAGDRRAPAAPGEVPDGEAADRPIPQDGAGRGRTREGGTRVEGGKNSTGPEVSGRDTIQPPTAGPQRRTARRLAPPTISGVSVSLSRRSGTPSS